MLISLNRHIFNSLLSSEEALAKTYVREKVLSKDGYGEILSGDEMDLVTRGIFDVVSKNEALIASIGLGNYYHENYSAASHICGCYYSGNLVVVPFDWAMANEHDENFEYTFNLARLL